MLKLAIVGSRSLENSVEATQLIQRILMKAKVSSGNDLEIVTGGAIGIDLMAENMAKDFGIRVRLFRPKGVGWIYYKARNDQIAKYCDELECIYDPNSRTHGCLYTATKAEKLGKKVVRTSISVEQPACEMNEVNEHRS